MNELIIAPSILSLDFSRVNEELEELVNSKAKWLHFDVMDGCFVPNITFGIDVLRGFKKKTNLFMDVHLMISDPIKYAPVFIENGADMITFHYESFQNIKECISFCEEIKRFDCKCGITIKPNTDVSVLDEILGMIDMVLIMSVEPGFGGQKFQSESLDKIKYLNQKRLDDGYTFRIEIDGGIIYETAKSAVNAGCDTLVAGSYIFSNDIKESIDTLICLK